MTAPSLLIGGQRRILNHVASGRRVGAVKPAVDLAALPMRTNNTAVPLDRDQGQLSSCAANSLDECYAAILLGNWSRLFAYYFARGIEGDRADDGVTIADLMDVAQTIGMPAEFLWEYDPAKYDDAPPTLAVDAAQANRVTLSDQIADLDHLLYELARPKPAPILFGFRVPASMEDGKGDTATTGIVRVPSDADPAIGGHCVVARNFDRQAGLVECTSHYGTGYGKGGAIYLPFAHWTSGNATDMRAIRRIGTTT